MKMKFLISINLCILLFITSNVYSVTKEEVNTIISTVQAELNNIENNFSMRKHIPFDIYNQIVLHLISSSIHLKDRNYENAYYYAQMCSIKVNTLKVLIEVGQYKEKTERLYIHKPGKKSDSQIGSDCTIADVPLNPIMKANLGRKGTALRIDLLDKNLFKPRTFTLSPKGKNKLKKIVEAILSFPDSKVKIVGHTRWEDYRKHSKWKAKVVYNYLTSKGVDQDKTTFLGVGNRIVMDTPWGLRRVSRVEIIIFDIKLSEQVVKKETKPKEKKVKLLKKVEEEEGDETDAEKYRRLQKGGFIDRVN